MIRCHFGSQSPKWLSQHSSNLLSLSFCLLAMATQCGHIDITDVRIAMEENKGVCAQPGLLSGLTATGAEQSLHCSVDSVANCRADGVVNDSADSVANYSADRVVNCSSDSVVHFS